ncbi:hypothetical protein JOQ06_018939, partial [Pogonophryne albipinna]
MLTITPEHHPRHQGTSCFGCVSLLRGQDLHRGEDGRGILEHLWRELKLPDARHQPQNLKGLERVFREEWTNILPEMCTDLESSYKKRLTSVCPT